MDRRKLLVSGVGVVSAFSGQAQTAASGFEAALEEFESNPDLLENSWLFKDQSVARGVGTGQKSSRKISEKATDLIIRLEVGSQARYERMYQGAIWPKGLSGVTIGIGYDLRFSSDALLQRDWGKLLDNATLDLLRPALGLRNEAAQKFVAGTTGVRVPWSAAHKQFVEFLPYPTAQAQAIFANSEMLSNDSFGALVSLVYNRGSAIPKNKADRQEMYRIHELMKRKEFKGIPKEIRSMKRLWTTPESRGLVIRRELEASLFEEGLR